MCVFGLGGTDGLIGNDKTRQMERVSQPDDAFVGNVLMIDLTMAIPRSRIVRRRRRRWTPRNISRTASRPCSSSRYGLLLSFFFALSIYKEYLGWPWLCVVEPVPPHIQPNPNTGINKQNELENRKTTGAHPHTPNTAINKHTRNSQTTGAGHGSVPAQVPRLRLRPRLCQGVRRPRGRGQVSACVRSRTRAD